MILFELNNRELKSEDIQICRQFVEGNDMEDIPVGRYELEAGIYAMVSVRQTVDIEDNIWEAHKKYLDLHYAIEGSEIIYVGNTDEMETGEYVPEKDYVPVNGGSYTTFLCLTTGMAVLLEPNDAHMVKCNVEKGKSTQIKRIVFKIPVK